MGYRFFSCIAGYLGMSHFSVFDCAVQALDRRVEMRIRILLIGRRCMRFRGLCVLGHAYGVAFLAAIDSSLGMFHRFRLVIFRGNGG